MIPQGRVCEGAGRGRALHFLTGRREPVLGWCSEFEARECGSTKGEDTEALGPSGRLKGFA